MRAGNRRHLHPGPDPARRGGGLRLCPRAVQHALRLRGGGGAHLHQRRPGPPGDPGAHGAGRGQRHPGHLPPATGRRHWGCGVPSAPPGRWRRWRARTWSSWPAAWAWLPCGPPSTTCSSTAPDYGNLELIYGARTPADLLYRRELERWRGRFDLRVHVTVDTAAADWRGNVGVVTTDHSPGPASTRPTPPPWSAAPS